MKGRARKMVWGMATEEGMRREFRNSNERNKAEKDGSKACAIAEQSKVGFSFVVLWSYNHHPVLIISPMNGVDGHDHGVFLCYLEWRSLGGRTYRGVPSRTASHHCLIQIMFTILILETL